LIADNRIVEPCFERVSAHRLEHPAGDEHDVDTCRTRGGNRGLRPRSQKGILADQRAVEVAGERLDLPRKVLREVQPCGFVRKSTSALRSAGGRSLYDFGMTPFG
jgi:hypothetical protein